MVTAGGTPGSRCIYFGDFVGGSMLGDRQQLAVEYSRERYFDSDQSAWRGTARIAVNIHGDGKGSTYGPIVAGVNP
jgi:HK97 family phage major capsid protein